MKKIFCLLVCVKNTKEGSMRFAATTVEEAAMSQSMILQSRKKRETIIAGRSVVLDAVLNCAYCGSYSHLNVAFSTGSKNGRPR